MYFKELAFTIAGLTAGFMVALLIIVYYRYGLLKKSWPDFWFIKTKKQRNTKKDVFIDIILGGCSSALFLVLTIVYNGRVVFFEWLEASMLLIYICLWFLIRYWWYILRILKQGKEERD